MACKPQYKGIRYNSLEELYKANGGHLYGGYPVNVNVVGKTGIYDSYLG